MTVELMHTLAIAGFVIAGILCVLAVVLFFVFKIPAVIGDLSGRTAQKAIENIRLQNEMSANGDKVYVGGVPTNGALTDKISGSGRLMRHHTSPLVAAARTEKIATDNIGADNNGYQTASNETTLLSGNNGETSVLSEQGLNETTVLSQDMLDQSVEEKNSESQRVQNTYGIEEEITYMDTQEIIE